MLKVLYAQYLGQNSVIVLAVDSGRTTCRHVKFSPKMTYPNKSKHRCVLFLIKGYFYHPQIHTSLILDATVLFLFSRFLSIRETNTKKRLDPKLQPIEDVKMITRERSSEQQVKWGHEWTHFYCGAVAFKAQPSQEFNPPFQSSFSIFPNCIFLCV